MTKDELREAVAVAFGGTQPFVEDYAKADRIIALVLEEAARVAEEWEPLITLLPFADDEANNFAHTGQLEAAERVAAAIRAMIPEGGNE